MTRRCAGAGRQGDCGGEQVPAFRGFTHASVKRAQVALAYPAFPARLGTGAGRVGQTFSVIETLSRVCTDQMRRTTPLAETSSALRNLSAFRPALRIHEAKTSLGLPRVVGARFGGRGPSTRCQPSECARWSPLRPSSASVLRDPSAFRPALRIHAAKTSLGLPRVVGARFGGRGPSTRCQPSECARWSPLRPSSGSVLRNLSAFRPAFRIHEAKTSLGLPRVVSASFVVENPRHVGNRRNVPAGRRCARGAGPGFPRVRRRRRSTDRRSRWRTRRFLRGWERVQVPSTRRFRSSQRCRGSAPTK
jgi:hypothetical protein